ncbi:M10 family metallopeptidase C-terminal domain-containing protein [Quatrionicoccus australiensis]|uniref:M10 family metallopeptidase C-terminal domain-containing protein n=1 Tax=Quatrionicoccus australiensis TaxID=138118 RepID=UPI001CFB9FF9|nr:M10 family metallopeptidase C-terminal domain-containing protein [Quatrionicoccus australiensis]MCB4359610.1 M10 family metallopeptidase C-terminal domain-containing protein [Quatrionicoccus australiensis]
MAAKPIYNDAQVVTSLTNTGGAAWHSSVITYNFPTSISAAAPENVGFSHATASQQAMTDYWMRAWDDVVGASIVRIADSATANITLANSAAPSYAYSYYPSSDGAGVYLNPAYGSNSGTNNLVNPTLGEWGGMAIGHEIGHALGLSHPGAYSGGSPTYEMSAVYMQDSQQYTIMSYFSAAKTGSDWIAGDNKVHYAQTPMMNDIMALQALYGVDTSTRSGNTVYGFNSTLTGTVFDFAANAHPVLCIYDAAGNDTLDLSGFAGASRISLVAGSFSNADAMTNNISIARNVVIENAVGGAGNDTLIGNAADNILNGGGGIDSMTGGLGHDTYVVDNLKDKVIELAGQGNDTVISALSLSLGANLENLVLSGSANINATGSAVANSLLGNAGDNILNGLAGADIMAGGLGNDIYVVDNAQDIVIEQLGQGTDTVLSAISYTLTGNVENLALAGTASINGAGNVLDNTLSGNRGNNLLDGGAGNDIMAGGIGNDTYILDSTSDVVVELVGQGVDTVLSAFGQTLSANIENLTLTGTAAVNATGNALANTLTGNAANNLLDGGAGADTLIGGLGNDIFMVENPYDKIVELLNQGTDNVFSSVSCTLAANLENLTLTGLTASSGVGNALDNTLAGNGASNILNGGAGNDILIGGLGADKLTGGIGADIFRFLGLGDSSAGAARDIIYDFSNAQGDRIDLTQLLTGITLPNNQSLHWADAGFTGVAGDLCFKSGVLMADTNGDAKADFEVQLIGVTTQLTHACVLI